MLKINSLPNSYISVSGVALLFFIISLCGILNHELWLDEAHHYLLARDSSSLYNLFINTRYEGHPVLWNTLLFVLTRWTTNPIWMQLLHVCIMTGAVFIFLKNAPFAWSFKLLFIFGYYILFEYNLFSRNYSLGLLFIFLACSLYQHRESRFITLSLVLGIACNSHAIFLLLACAIMSLVTLERVLLEKKVTSLRLWMGILTFLSLAILSLVQIIPPLDTTFFDKTVSMSLIERMTRACTPLFKSLILIPDMADYSFWNTHLIVNHARPIAVILSVFSFFFPWFLFKRNIILVCYVYFGIVITIIFYFATNLSATRYFGVIGCEKFLMSS